MILKFLKSVYNKVKASISKTGSALGTNLRSLFGKAINETGFEELERLLYEADLGVQTVSELTVKVRAFHKENPSVNAEAYIELLRKELLAILTRQPNGIIDVPAQEGPLVIMIVGVNGNGKTTSVAKLAHRLKEEGKKVIMGAADTFRAAAMEQLEMWAQRVPCDVVKGHAKSDPAAVVFDTMAAAKARGANVVLIDTAGRLHTKTNLMQELEKMRRSCKKTIPNAPHETLLVLDATTGQNAIDQAKTFNQYTPITGIILTKLDGTAKGGIVVAIQRQLGIPIKFIGVGEQIGDLEPFDAEAFVNALFE